MSSRSTTARGRTSASSRGSRERTDPGSCPTGDGATGCSPSSTNISARKAGNEQASRAAGGALGANPIPIVVPCHRVIATDGSLGGYAGGLPAKRRLLTLERGESSVPAGGWAPSGR
ncbi:MAG: MGMT family protein [Chloroflexi bacterium]|nr:MAG: MGMT family protein [Chloroflexota bacterium]